MRTKNVSVKAEDEIYFGQLCIRDEALFLQSLPNFAQKTGVVMKSVNELTLETTMSAGKLALGGKLPTPKAVAEEMQNRPKLRQKISSGVEEMSEKDIWHLLFEDIFDLDMDGGELRLVTPDGPVYLYFATQTKAAVWYMELRKKVMGETIKPMKYLGGLRESLNLAAPGMKKESGQNEHQ